MRLRHSCMQSSLILLVCQSIFEAESDVGHPQRVVAVTLRWLFLCPCRASILTAMDMVPGTKLRCKSLRLEMRACQDQWHH